MAKFIVDKIDDVPEALRGEYVEKDGKFHLKVDDLESHYAPRDMLSKANNESASRRVQLQAWEKLGKTPEEIAELLAKLEKEDHESKKKKGDFDGLLAQHQEKWQKIEADLKAERDAAIKNERNAVVNGQLSAELAKANATEDGLVFLPGSLAKRVKVETIDGKRVTRVYQEDGTSPMAGTGAGGMATVADLVKEALTKHPSLFKGNGAGGGGKDPGGKGGGGDGVTSKKQFKTERERSAWVDKNGMDAYKALAD